MSDFPDAEISRMSFDSFFKTLRYDKSALFIVCLDDMVSNFKALLFFERMSNDVVFVSKSHNIMKLCSNFGYQSVRIKTFIGARAMIRKGYESGRKIELLSSMEKNVIINLLNGESNVKLAKQNRLSDKTISHYKRSALSKVGLGNINLFFDNINKDIFKVL
jgi:DNA-binding CsgD family transcriptional regulator